MTSGSMPGHPCREGRERVESAVEDLGDLADPDAMRQEHLRPFELGVRPFAKGDLEQEIRSGVDHFVTNSPRLG